MQLYLTRNDDRTICYQAADSLRGTQRQPTLTNMSLTTCQGVCGFPTRRFIDQMAVTLDGRSVDAPTDSQ